MSASRVKDVLLEHVSRDIKQLQSLQCDMSTVMDMISSSNGHAQSLCEHLDHLLMHGLRDPSNGYWPFVQYFTRSEAVHSLKILRNVQMDIGRGRAWLAMALNEQALESYVKMFIENQNVCKNFYLLESFTRDVERLVLLQTLVAGLDFISFDLAVDCDYLDFAPNEPCSKLGISQGHHLTPDIEPSFLSSTTTVSLSSSDHSQSLQIHDSNSGLTRDLAISSSATKLDSTVTIPTKLVSTPQSAVGAVSFLDRMYADKVEDELIVCKPKKQRKKKKKRSKVNENTSNDTDQPVNDRVSSVKNSIGTTVEKECITTYKNAGVKESTTNEERTTIEETTAVKESTVIEETTAVKESTMIEENTVVKESIMIEESTVVKESTMIEESTIVKESTMIKENTAVNESAMIEESTAVKENTMIEENIAINKSTTQEQSEVLIAANTDETDAFESTFSDHGSKPVVVALDSVGGPHQITEGNWSTLDVSIDENTRLVLSLDVLIDDSEEPVRLVQLATPASVGQQKIAYCLVTNRAVYILRRDGIEGNYSKELGISYSEFDHIVIGLGWQSLALVYHSRQSGLVDDTERCILLTGIEAVSRSLVESIRGSAAVCPGFLCTIPLKRDDEVRLEAIERELIKLGSETSMDVVLYSLVNWEQVHGDPPPIVLKARQPRDSVSGWLHVKSVNVLGLPVWKQAYFKLKSGTLYQFSNEEDSQPRAVYTIRNSGGCTRVAGESKPFTISILLDKEGSSLLLATTNEQELSIWLQALCVAVMGQETEESFGGQRTCLNCALLLTQNMLHILLEDWNSDSMQLVTSCKVTDLNDISVDSALPLYCTVAYDHGSTQGMWLICFNSEFELHKFERAVCKIWEEAFQISLNLNTVTDAGLRQKAHQAVELMADSKHRSDSITRGRSEFTYDTTF